MISQNRELWHDATAPCSVLIPMPSAVPRLLPSLFTFSFRPFLPSLSVQQLPPRKTFKLAGRWAHRRYARPVTGLCREHLSPAPPPAVATAVGRGDCLEVGAAGRREAGTAVDGCAGAPRCAPRCAQEHSAAPLQSAHVPAARPRRRPAMTRRRRPRRETMWTLLPHKARSLFSLGGCGNPCTLDLFFYSAKSKNKNEYRSLENIISPALLVLCSHIQCQRVRSNLTTVSNSPLWRLPPPAKFLLANVCRSLPAFDLSSSRR